MSAFDKMEYELYAILSLQKAFWQFAENLVKGESPDWWNDTDDIGIEVVRAVNPHIGYATAFSNRYLGKQKKSIPVKEIRSFQGDVIFNKSGRLVAISDTKGLFDGTRHIQLAITAARKKLSLLNSSAFRRFKRNCLYIYLTASLCDRDCEQFIREYKKCSSEFQW